MNRPAAASTQGWRNSTIHRDVDNRNAHWVFKVVLGVAIAVVPLAVYLLQTMSYVQTSYAIEQVRGRETQLVELERRLTFDRDHLESLPEVEKHAGSQLGLEHATASHVVVISSGEIGRTAPSPKPSYRPPSR